MSIRPVDHGVMAGQGGFAPLEATGGTIVSYSSGGFDWKAHKFTGNGTFTISANAMATTIDIVVIGPGWNGGNGTSSIVGIYTAGGGGGAGSSAYKTGLAGAVTTYAIAIDTSNSSFNHANASGVLWKTGRGGEGGTYSGGAGDSSFGGCGGGAGGFYHSSTGDQFGTRGAAHDGSGHAAAFDTYYAYPGGLKYGSNSNQSFGAGGGGGGAGYGSDGTSSQGGNGAYGRGWGTIGGSTLDMGQGSDYFADGGGGGSTNGSYSSESTGGHGNGGNGAVDNTASTLAVNATSYTGSGGGGCSNSANAAPYTGTGSTGVVLIRYKVSA